MKGRGLTPPAGARKGLPYIADAVRLRATWTASSRKWRLFRTQAPSPSTPKTSRCRALDASTPKPSKVGRRYDGLLNPHCLDGTAAG